jgi:hypothetical protein
MPGDFILGVAVAATGVPQLPQNAVPASNCVPHFVQNAIEIPFVVHDPGCFPVFK